MGSCFCQCTLTSYSNADSVVQDDDGHLIFVKPCEVEEPFQKMLKLVQEQELKQSSGNLS